jgi:uncharacterized protein YceH (UPF0502 family)
VLALGERDVNDALLRLRVAGLIEFVQLAGSRVERYAHKAGAALHLEPAEVAVLAELLLRGAQQPGELRSRVARMHALPTLEALQAALDGLAARELVVKHTRRKGERAERWAQLLAPERDASPEGAADPRPQAASGPRPASTAADLEARVAKLEAEVAELRARLGSP